uniref:RING-type domain-containing protein n=1 Tax=Palpitomonas bilix TaxID=652834 RepID=A0A7S3GBE7_9EUKA
MVSVERREGISSNPGSWICLVATYVLGTVSAPTPGFDLSRTLVDPHEWNESVEVEKSTTFHMQGRFNGRSSLSVVTRSVSAADKHSFVSISARQHHDGNERTVAILVINLEGEHAFVEFRPVHAARVCRFCQVALTESNSAPVEADTSPSLTDVCTSDLCQQAKAASCPATLACGHACCGVAGEENHISCLHPDCTAKRSENERDWDSPCSICYDSLSAAPVVQLKSCSHLFHVDCLKSLLAQHGCKDGKPISYGFIRCPDCREELDIDSVALKEEYAKAKTFFDLVSSMAERRLQYERENKQLDKDELADLEGDDAPYKGKESQYALSIYNYFVCNKCSHPFFGGRRRCGEIEDVDPKDLLCGACNPAGPKDCEKHGSEFLQWKCRFCCSVAVFFCFGTHHFCDDCHERHQAVMETPVQKLPKCTPATCPLGVNHPANGTEFFLGCGLCRKLDAF